MTPKWPIYVSNVSENASGRRLSVCGSKQGVSVVGCVQNIVRDFFRGPEGSPEKISTKTFRIQKSRIFQRISHTNNAFWLLQRTINFEPIPQVQKSRVLDTIGALRSANMRNMISVFDTLSHVNDRKKIVFGSFML